MAKIKVNEKALAHLSRGLYRSPASALRELVSNAWDADARAVRIQTNYPNFLQISVQDDGAGFTKAEFGDLMEGGIGNSSKRSREPVGKTRPIIGRLGIGLLGIAQICPRFTITSQPVRGEGFRARVELYDLLKEKLDRDDETIIAPKEVDVGEYHFESFESKGRTPGTIIIADDVHPTFTRAFRDSLKFEEFKKPPRRWSDALRIVSGVGSLQQLGDYWRLLWELSACCPVPYLSASSLPNRLIADDHQRLAGYDFKVLVDGLQLFKPVRLAGNPGGYTTKRIEPQVKKIYGRELSFHGYIAVQEGTQLRPDELRGILIRIKDIGIGYYDQSMLDYRINEGPRSRWLTGEIFVDNGLEDALNIDRDSFNRFHPEFRAIQEFVHNLLQKQIFPKVYEQIDVRSAARQKYKAKTRQRQIASVFSREVESPVSVKFTAKPDARPKVVAKSTTTGKARVDLPNPKDLDTKKSYRQLASAILGIFEVAIRKQHPDEQRDTFKRLLLDLLDHW